MFRRHRGRYIVIDRLRKDVYFVDRATWTKLQDPNTVRVRDLDGELSDLRPYFGTHCLPRPQVKRLRSHSHHAIDETLRDFKSLFFCTIETTTKCNLRCSHCYHGNRTSAVARQTLTTDEIRRIIDELRDAGCISLVFTGGEFLLRPDYREIVAHTSRTDLLVTILTNGIALTQRALDCLEKYGVDGVQVSLYGTNALTVEASSNRAFHVAWAHLAKARTRSLAVTAVLTPTISNWAFIESVSAALSAESVPFSYNLDLHPTLAGSIQNTRSGVLSHVESLKRLEAVYRHPTRRRRQTLDERACNAGYNLLHVTCEAGVTPCICWNERVGSLRSSSLKQIWAGRRLREIRRTVLSEFDRCPTCSLVYECAICPGMNFATEGANTVPSPLSCRYTHNRVLAEDQNNPRTNAWTVASASSPAKTSADVSPEDDGRTK